MAVPKKKTSKAKSRSRRASAWTLSAPARSVCPQCHNAKLPMWSAPPAGGTRVARPSTLADRAGPGHVAANQTRSLPVAVDAMGGDRAPGRSSPAPSQAAEGGLAVSWWGTRPSWATPAGWP